MQRPRRRTNRGFVNGAAESPFKLPGKQEEEEQQAQRFAIRASSCVVRRQQRSHVCNADKRSLRGFALSPVLPGSPFLVRLLPVSPASLQARRGRRSG